jgi:hypothetical protein
MDNMTVSSIASGASKTNRPAARHTGIRSRFCAALSSTV